MANEHILKLGKLVGNLQSLECLLRAYLLAVGQECGDVGSGPPYWDLRVGDSVPEDAFTNYDSLGKLIDCFNHDIVRRGGAPTVDPAVVVIRDLLAHGRVAATSEDLADMKIIKFDRPQNGKVEVVASTLMDDFWFDYGIKLTHAQIVVVHDAYQRLAV